VSTQNLLGETERNYETVQQ